MNTDRKWKDSLPGSFPSCGWIAGSSTHLNGGEGSRGGDMMGSDSRQGW